jgi:hypothetical protein
MRTPAQPRVTLYVQVNVETDKLRRRLEAATGFSASRLVTEALQLFEKHLSSFAPPKPSRFADNGTSHERRGPVSSRKPCSHGRGRTSQN